MKTMDGNELNKPNFLGGEINGYKADKVIGEKNLSTLRDKTAESLLNGLGETIKNDIAISRIEEVERKEKKESGFKKIINKFLRVCDL